MEIKCIRIEQNMQDPVTDQLFKMGAREESGVIASLQVRGSERPQRKEGSYGQGLKYFSLLISNVDQFQV